MRDYQQIEFWKRSHKLVLRIYLITKAFPRDEMYGLISQMRRSSASIATNIAEGCGRHTNPDLRRFLRIAAGSSSELNYQLLLSRDLNYISEQLYKELFDEVTLIRKMIFKYCEKL